MKICGGLRFGVAALLGTLFLVESQGGRAADACRDPIDEIVRQASAEWPISEPYWLSAEWVEYFVLGYNAQDDRARDLMADKVVVFPVEDGYDFVFAFKDGCMTMYMDLSSSKTYHLIELGHALAKGH